MWTEAMVSVCRAWCFPSFLRSGLVAGEAVKLLRALFLFFVSLPCRGGEERNWRWSVSRFCCRWSWVVLSGGPAPAGRGGEGSSFWRWFRAGGGGPGRRGGEDRNWRGSASRFCCRWSWVVISGGPAPAGRGGEGSSFWRWAPRAGGGGLGCRGGGWKKGGGERMVLWPCSFIETRFRRWAADGFCGCLRHVVVLPLGGGRYGVA